MQTKNKRLACFGFMLMAVVVCSCKKLVDVGDPVNTITTTGVFSTNEQANSAMAAVYSRMMTNTGQLQFSNGGITLYAGLSADELLNLNETPLEQQFLSNGLQQDNSLVYTCFWQPAYKCIYDANAILEGLAASVSGLLHDNVRKELTGEAKFIRAFCYFYLTNLFGDVPLVLVTDVNQTALMKRTPQEEIYRQIVSDLEEAQELLITDYSFGGGERIRANKWAATALLARVYLYMQEWAKAAEQASAVINNSNFELVTGLDNVFLKNSREAIWQLQQNNLTDYMPKNGTWDGANFVPPLLYYEQPPAFQAQLLDFYEFGRLLITPLHYCTGQMANAFEPNDQRSVQWLNSTPDKFGPEIYYPYKYKLRVVKTGDPVTRYYMVLRLAEQYLIRAEARAQLGQPGADTDLNAIRNRAGLPNTPYTAPADLLTAIAQERRVELFAEWGHRWFDLKRTGQAITTLTAAGKSISSYALLYPIPENELRTDPFLTQNTGY